MSSRAGWAGHSRNPPSHLPPPSDALDQATDRDLAFMDDLPCSSTAGPPGHHLASAPCSFLPGPAGELPPKDSTDTMSISAQPPHDGPTSVAQIHPAPKSSTPDCPSMSAALGGSSSRGKGKGKATIPFKAFMVRRKLADPPSRSQNSTDGEDENESKDVKPIGKQKRKRVGQACRTLPSIHPTLARYPSIQGLPRGRWLIGYLIHRFLPSAKIQGACFACYRPHGRARTQQP